MQIGGTLTELNFMFLNLIVITILLLSYNDIIFMWFKFKKILLYFVYIVFAGY